VDEIWNHIVRFIQDDDWKSFEVVYKHYHDMIFNFIRRFAAGRGSILTREDAEDILIEVFLNVWEKRKIFRICFKDEGYKDFIGNFPDTEKIFEPFVTKKSNKVYVGLAAIKALEKDKDLRKAFDEIMKHVDEGFEDWLFLIAKFKVNDYIDYINRLRPPIEPVPPPEPIPPLDRDQIEGVLRLLAPLNNRNKEALFLKDVIEMPYEWLAKVLHNNNELACLPKTKYRDFLTNFPDAEKILVPFVREENHKVYMDLAKIKDQGKDKDLGEAFDKIMELLWQTEAVRLRQRIHIARRTIKNSVLTELSERELKRGREWLQDVCRKTREKLIKLREELPEENNEDKELLDGYIRDLESWMEALESW